MSVDVRIPSPLRKFTQGQPSVDASGVTIGDMIADLEASYIKWAVDQQHHTGGKVGQGILQSKTDDDASDTKASQDWG